MTIPYPALFEPLTIGHLRLKNRIMSTSHAPAYAEDGMPKECYYRYHEEKARGGLALSMFGGSSTISIDSPPPFGQINLGEDRVIPWPQSFSEGIHRHGCATMIQITHMGRRGGVAQHPCRALRLAADLQGSLNNPSMMQLTHGTMATE